MCLGVRLVDSYQHAQVFLPGFGTGITTANFHAVGKNCSLMAALYMYISWTIVFRGKRFKMKFCIPSSPGALRDGEWVISRLTCRGLARYLYDCSESAGFCKRKLFISSCTRDWF